MKKETKQQLALNCLGLDETNNSYKCRIHDVACHNFKCDHRCCWLDCPKVDECEYVCKHIRILNEKTGEVKIMEVGESNEHKHI